MYCVGRSWFSLAVVNTLVCGTINYGRTIIFIPNNKIRVQSTNIVDVSRVQGTNKVDVSWVQGTNIVDVSRVQGTNIVDVSRVQSTNIVYVSRVQGTYLMCLGCTVPT